MGNLPNKTVTKKTIPTPTTVLKNSTNNTNITTGLPVSVNVFLKQTLLSVNVTKFMLVSITPMLSGSMVNNLNVKTNLKGYSMYTITNITMLNNRKIKSIQVYINNKGNNIVTSTRITKSGYSTNVYNHFNQTLLNTMVSNHLIKHNYLPTPTPTK